MLGDQSTEFFYFVANKGLEVCNISLAKELTECFTTSFMDSMAWGCAYTTGHS